MRRSADATRRLRAVQASVSTERLTQALDDPSPEVVRAAIARLVELRGHLAATALRDRLLDVDLALVSDIAKALERIGDDRVVETARAALDDQRSTRRLAAVRALGVVSDGRAVAWLEGALDDGVAGVRSASLDALAGLGDRVGPGAASACARLLSDPVAHVRIAAVRAVARLKKHPGAVLGPVAEDGDRLVRLAVACHLTALPEHCANRLLADPDLRVREAAARAAGLREVGALAVLLTEDPARDVRRAAAHGLGGMQDERVADVLLPGLEDRDVLVRVAVLRALEQLLSRAGVVRRLCHELAAARAQRRRASLYALARLNAREAAAEASRLADDSDPEVRLALVQSAEALFDEPVRVMRYMASDADSAVRQAAEMWLLRAAYDVYTA